MSRFLPLSRALTSRKTKKYRVLRSSRPVCAHTIEVEDFFDERFDEVDCEDKTDAATAVEPAEVTEPLTPLTIEELLEEQKEDEFCQEARARLADNPNCQYFEDHHGLICRRAQKDNAEQIILPKTLRSLPFIRD